MSKPYFNLEQDPEVVDERILRFVDLALPICQEIDRVKKHASLIVRKGRLLAVGTNAFKGHPVAHKLGYRYSEMHSELNALLKCPLRDRITLINVRYNKQGQLRMARPCPLCLPWCQAVFDEIYYSCPDGRMRRLDTEPPLGHNSCVGLTLAV
jgi:hypothetical protein